MRMRLSTSGLAAVFMLTGMLIGGEQPARPSGLDYTRVEGCWAVADVVQRQLGDFDAEVKPTQLEFAVDKDPKSRWEKYPDFSYTKASEVLGKHGEIVVGSGSLVVTTQDKGSSAEMDLLFTQFGGGTHARLVIHNAGWKALRIVHVRGLSPEQDLLFVDWTFVSKEGGFLVFRRLAKDANRSQ